MAEAVEILGGVVTDDDRERFAQYDINFTAFGAMLGVSAETVLETFTDALAQISGGTVCVVKKGPLN